jgi:hypothetical protein
MVPGDGETRGPREARGPTGTGAEVAAGGELLHPARTRAASRPGRIFHK